MKYLQRGPLIFIQKELIRAAIAIGGKGEVVKQTVVVPCKVSDIGGNNPCIPVAHTICSTHGKYLGGRDLEENLLWADGLSNIHAKTACFFQGKAVASC